MREDERSVGHGIARTTYPALVTVSPTAPQSPEAPASPDQPKSAEGPAAAAIAATGPSAVSLRVAAAEQRALDRLRSQGERLRLLLWPVTALVVLPTLFSRPRPGWHGDGLVVVICLIVFVVAVLVVGFWAKLSRPSTWVDLLLPLVMGAVGFGLVGVQDGTSGQVAVSVGVVLAFLRRPCRGRWGSGECSPPE